jgi:hypothetical protein
MTLYKYALAERIDVLRNGLIRFSQPSVLNDPWEMRPHIKSVFGDEFYEREVVGPLMRRTNDELIDEMTRILFGVLRDNNINHLSPDDLRALVAEADRQFPGEMVEMFSTVIGEAAGVLKEALPHVIETIPSSIDKTIGLLSLTEKPDHPLMWSHYAGNHSGIVLAFNETHEFFTTRLSDDDPISGLHKIVYTEERPTFESFIDMDMRDQPEPWLNKVFFTKSKEWEYEQEWRMIKVLKQATKVIEHPEGNIHLFAFPPGCVSGVILGQKMRDEHRKATVDFIRNDERYKHVIIFEAESSSTSYALSIKTLS